MAANIRKEKYIVDFNDEGEKKMNNEFNNFCNQDDTYDDVNLTVGEGVSGNNNQKIAAELEAESTETPKTTSSQATHKK